VDKESKAIRHLKLELWNGKRAPAKYYVYYYCLFVYIWLFINIYCTKMEGEKGASVINSKRLKNLTG
jgi:hypothetical protein